MKTFEEKCRSNDQIWRGTDRGQNAFPRTSVDVEPGCGQGHFIITKASDEVFDRQRRQVKRAAPKMIQNCDGIFLFLIHDERIRMLGLDIVGSESLWWKISRITRKNDLSPAPDRRC